MKQSEIETLEIELLLNAIYSRYGYDFRNYARASLNRRVLDFLAKTEFHKISELLTPVLYDHDCFQSLLYSISVTVTEMFRDPSFYKKLRQEIIPYLQTYPHIKIWNAGCSTGEEVYSIAILLKEEGIYDRCQIYASDFNDHALAKAREGIYAIEKIKLNTANYQKSGGKKSFADFYLCEYGSVIMNRDLKQNVTFAHHNLVVDQVFGEMNMIICRNVLIYFDSVLQNKVLKLFHDSLKLNAFLCLGKKESIQFSEIQEHFIDYCRTERIYQKTR